MYEPREDSFLLLKSVKKYSKGNVLDMGTGSGILAYEASELKEVEFVIGLDIDEDSIEYCNKKYGSDKLIFLHSDLFEIFNEINNNKYEMLESNFSTKNLVLNTALLKNNFKFDTIIFNPPYLPQDKGIKDKSIYGGKKGYELIERFLDNVRNYLAKNGIILLLFSSLTNKDKINNTLDKNNFKYKEIDKLKLDFEELYVYLICQKSKISEHAQKPLVFDTMIFAKGKRGVIYKKKNVMTKVKNPKSKAKARIKNEAKYMKLLNKHNIGPKFISFKNNKLKYYFVKGDYIVDYIKKSDKKQIIKILKGILKQCYIMDKLNINKLEMHHPVKHIIVDKKPVLIDAKKSKISGISKTAKAVLIDFERCYKTNKPKNVTQFVQFIISKNLSKVLKEKGINLNRKKMISLSRKYKKSKNINDILKLIT